MSYEPLLLLLVAFITTHGASNIYPGYSVFKDTGIRAGESLLKGARIVDEVRGGFNGDLTICVTQCNKGVTPSSCDTIIFNPNTNMCTLYSCGTPSVCVLNNSNQTKFSALIKDVAVTTTVSQTQESDAIDAYLKFPPQSDSEKDVLDGKWQSNSLQQDGQDGEDVCNEEKYIGPCRAAIPRFYFNSQTKTCDEFIYGGCRANGNNFKTKKDCQTRCVDAKHKPEPTNNADKPKDKPASNKNNSSSLQSAAHRHEFEKTRSDDTMTALHPYELQAIIPLVMGVLMSLLLVVLIVIRCRINKRRGPNRFRKLVYADGDVNDSEVVNGMYT